MWAPIVSLGRKMVTHPFAMSLGSIGLFLGSFASVDYNSEIEEECIEITRRESEKLAESLEQLHVEALLERMTFDDMRVNRNRCPELYFLYRSAEKKKLELKQDKEFTGRSDSELEAVVASEFYGFTERMCRRAMIRNFHFIKWFKVMQDEFFKYYLAQKLLGFFGKRYFQMIDKTTVSKS